MRKTLRLLRGLILFLALAVLLVVLAGGAVIWVTLPGGDLQNQIPALEAGVDVTIDTDGIPRIHAVNERDAAMALGFLHARERMFQMDLMRRAARGELSELIGSATLRLDEFNRTLNLRDRAAADVAQLSPETRSILDGYAAGVNAWIERRGRFSALEFAVLGAPRPWTAADSLLWGKTMGLYLSSNWRTELARLSLAGRLTHAQIEALWPASSARTPQAALSPARALGLADVATRLAAQLPRFPAPFTLPASASNEWAVDGAHSASGAPLLAGDPHLSFGLPGFWYLARIDTPRGALVGATAPGVPFLVLGRNSTIAWTFTTTGADVQDLFIETPSNDGYMTETGPRPFVRRTETIHVRGAPDKVLQVRETRHGPIISDLVGDHSNLISLEMANLAPGDGSADGLYALNRARTVAEAGAAAARITSPVQNMLVVDHETIGFYVTGRVPIRKSGDGAFAARGDDGSGEWVGWAQGDVLPHDVAPASGRLVNANERVAPPDFPINLGHDWFSDTRARRIRQMLDATPKPSAADFAAMQVDDLDLVAVALLPKLRPIAPILAQWDGRMRLDSAGALLFNAWMIDFSHSLLDTLHVPLSNAAATAPWPDLVRAALAPASHEQAALCADECDAMLRASYDRTIAALRARFGADAEKWRWADAHQAVFPALALRAVPVLGSLVEGRIGAIGSDSTVGRGGVRSGTLEAIHGAAYRGVYDLSDLDRSLFMIAPGQSGDPVSVLARNFLRKWRDGGTISIPSRPSSVAVHIRLAP